MRITYGIHDIRAYINWAYFYHAWGLSGKAADEQRKMRDEAEALLDDADGRYPVNALFGLFEAYSDGDDLLLEGVRMPMLRQQHPAESGKPCYCLADFVRPKALGIPDKVGVFATSVDHLMTADNSGDPYQKMLSQTVADRLAEAAAERLHEEVRKHYWGYAPDERLSIAEMQVEKFQGIRPAVGYPSMPDTSLNFIIDQLLDMGQIGVRLTESGMMTPHASVSGLMMAHPEARYFNLGKIGEDQLRDYARRRGVPVEMMRRFLASVLMR